MFHFHLIPNLILAIVITAITSGVAQASFQLRITSYSDKYEPNGEFMVTDQRAKTDNDPTIGGISIDRQVGGFRFSIAASSASKQHPRMGFNLNVTGKQSGYLLIELTDTDLSFNLAGTVKGQAEASIPNGSGIEFAAFLSRSNQEFGKTGLAAELCCDPQSGTSSYFGEMDHLALRRAGSLTLTALFRYAGDGENSSIQYEVADFANPEPTTVVSALLGVPILFGYLRRRRVTRDMPAT